MASLDTLQPAIWIEHGSARLAGIDEYRPILLRVIHLYRQEDDTWKIIHRHADALSEKIPWRRYCSLKERNSHNIHPIPAAP